MAAAGNNWIMVKCVGTRSNRSAIGARVRVTVGGRSQIDEVMSGSSYYSQNDLRLHFGLGRAAAADECRGRVAFGAKETFRDLPPIISSSSRKRRASSSSAGKPG